MLTHVRSRPRARPRARPRPRRTVVVVVLVVSSPGDFHLHAEHDLLNNTETTNIQVSGWKHAETEQYQVVEQQQQAEGQGQGRERRWWGPGHEYDEYDDEYDWQAAQVGWSAAFPGVYGGDGWVRAWCG